MVPKKIFTIFIILLLCFPLAAPVMGYEMNNSSLEYVKNKLQGFNIPDETLKNMSGWDIWVEDQYIDPESKATYRYYDHDLNMIPGYWAIVYWSESKDEWDKIILESNRTDPSPNEIIEFLYAFEKKYPVKRVRAGLVDFITFENKDVLFSEISIKEVQMLQIVEATMVRSDYQSTYVSAAVSWLLLKYQYGILDITLPAMNDKEWQPEINEYQRAAIESAYPKEQLQDINVSDAALMTFLAFGFYVNNETADINVKYVDEDFAGVYDDWIFTDDPRTKNHYITLIQNSSGKNPSSEEMIAFLNDFGEKHPVKYVRVGFVTFMTVENKSEISEKDWQMIRTIETTIHEETINLYFESTVQKNDRSDNSIPGFGISALIFGILISLICLKWMRCRKT